MTKLNTWTVYYNPSDYKGKYVVRRFSGATPTNDIFADEDYESCLNWTRENSKKFNQGKIVKFDRHPNDDKVIVETWI